MTNPLPTPLDYLLFGYKAVAVAGVPLPSEATLNIVSGATAVDNPTLGTTDLTITGSASPGLPWLVIDVTAAPYNADPTGATPCGAAVNAAIAAGVASGRRFAIYFPGSTSINQYSIDQTLLVNNCQEVAFIGDAGGSQLSLASSIVGISCVPATRHDFPPFRLVVEGLTIQGADSGSGYGIDCSNVGVTELNTVYIDNCSNGVYQHSTVTSVGGVPPCVIRVSGESAFGNATGSGIYVSGGGALTIDPGSDFFSNGTGISLLGAIGSTIGACGWVSNSTTDISIDSSCSEIDVSQAGTAKISDASGLTIPAIFNGTIASASTIGPKASPNCPRCYISGTTTIEHINAPASGGHLPVSFSAVFTNAGSVGTTGNISRAATFTAGQLVTFVYDPVEEVWFF